MIPPLILDTTLRDGEQSPGLYFTHDEKIAVARAIDRLGVDIIEAGIPAMGREEQAVLRELSGLRLRAEILAWNRLSIHDVMASLDAGVRNVHLSIPTSRQLLEKKLGKSEDWALTEMERVIRFAIDEGVNVSLGAEDASRTDVIFLRRVFKLAEDLGAKRVRYADTLGILTTEKTDGIMRELSSLVSIPIDFHGHNDFGLATANALGAWKAGAKVVSCSLLGWGERAGNTALEEFVGCAHFLEGLFPDFDFISLRSLCESLAGANGRSIPTHKPLFGSEIFKHESGIHIDGLLKDRTTYEAFDPERVGGKRELVVGKHSGRAAIRYLAAETGRHIDDREAQEIIESIRARTDKEKGVEPRRLFESLLSRADVSAIAK